MSRRVECDGGTATAHERFPHARPVLQQRSRELTSRGHQQRPAPQQIQRLTTTEAQNDIVAAPVRLVHTGKMLRAVLYQTRAGLARQRQHFGYLVPNTQQVDGNDRDRIGGKRGAQTLWVVTPTITPRTVARGIHHSWTYRGVQTSGNQLRTTVRRYDGFSA